MKSGLESNLAPGTVHRHMADKDLPLNEDMSNQKTPRFDSFCCRFLHSVAIVLPDDCFFLDFMYHFGLGTHCYDTRSLFNTCCTSHLVFFRAFERSD